MSGLDNLKTRLNYNGGENQVKRMNLAKLRSLKRAISASYQSATISIDDNGIEKRFKGLINPDRLQKTYDDKILSIPFEAPEINTSTIMETNIHPGDVISWWETEDKKTDWLVFLRNYEETAYFRAEIKRCRNEIEIGDKTYKIYIMKNERDKISWSSERGSVWNDLNYNIEFYITKNDETLNYLHRFKEIKIDGKPWQVQTIDEITVDGVIMVSAKEYFKNTIKDKIEEEEKQNPVKPQESKINGPVTVYPYDIVSYTIDDQGGEWAIDNSKISVLKSDDKNIKLSIDTGRSGKFKIDYKKDGAIVATLNVEIESL